MTTALERGLQALEVFKHAQTAQRKGWLARFGQGATNQIGIGAQHRTTWILGTELRLEGAAGRIQWPTNGLFQGLFESAVCVGNGGGRLT
ncbi:MAG TPA: hypothetical protein VKK81_11235 [Candidatus Binatia bacterium]|nr:hypothetical protein [Candidatus Binatia bacterium]